MRSHLIVAGVGTAALVGLAGTGIWMIMPSETGREILSRMESAPRMASAIAAPAPATDAVRAIPDAKARKTAQSAEAPANDSKGDRPFSVQRPRQAAAVNPIMLDPEPLASSDPRWSQPAGKTVLAPSSEVAAAQKAPPAPIPGSDLVAAYISQDPAEEKPAKAKQAAKTDEAATAAIASVRPEKPSSVKPKKTAAKADDDDTGKAAGRGTRVTQGVTMRAKPDNDGTALLTIPAKEHVQVVSCKGWCEVVYNGKRGYVYKKFLQNGGKS